MVRTPIIMEFCCFTKTLCKDCYTETSGTAATPQKRDQALNVHHMTLVQVSLKVFWLTACVSNQPVTHVDHHFRDKPTLNSLIQSLLNHWCCLVLSSLQMLLQQCRQIKKHCKRISFTKVNKHPNVSRQNKSAEPLERLSHLLVPVIDNVMSDAGGLHPLFQTLRLVINQHTIICVSLC